MANRTNRTKNSFQFVIFVVVAIIVLVGVFAINFISKSQDTRSQADSLDSQFVTRQGTKFFLGGKPFTFVGFNIFDAANTYLPPDKRGYSCPRDNGWWQDIYTEPELDKAFQTIKEQSGASVVRFWAFQRYTDGGTDWSGIDKVIRVARKNGLKVLPVLEDGAGYCTYPEPQGNAKWKYNGDTWYTEGYKIRQGNYKLTYPEYVKAIVSRYKDEPAIFGWMMMNEADTSRKVLADGSTKIDGNGPSVLVNFAKDIGGLIKSIDSKHLVTVGTQSNGASGATGPDFASVYGLSVIDFGEVHDWPYWGGDTDALPGSPDGSSLPSPDSPECQKKYGAKLGCSIAIAILKLNKPILMGEAGISARSSADRDRRAKLMDAKMNAFFRSGGAGYLVWQLNKVVDGEAFDVQLTTNDPLLAVMKKYALAYPVVVPGLPTAVPTIQATVIPTARPTIVPLTPSPVPRTPVPTFVPVTPRPTVTPTSKPLTGRVIQGESFGGMVISDSNAFFSKALLLSANGTTKGFIQGPVQKLVLRAKSSFCAGYGHLNVKVNGNYVMDVNITSGSYMDFTSNNFAYMNLKDQSYPIEIIFNNAYQSSSCIKTVTIDQITLQ